MCVCVCVCVCVCEFTSVSHDYHVISFSLNSSTNRREWGAELERILSQNTSYLLLTAEQMVGICLYIFVRPHLVPFIRSVGGGLSLSGSDTLMVSFPLEMCPSQQ